MNADATDLNDAAAARLAPARPGCGPMASAEGPLRRRVLDAVRAAGAAARIDLAKELGVSPASVGTIAAELIEAGFVQEVEPRRSEPRRDGDGPRGRPRVELGLRPEAGFVAGLKLSDHAHTAVVMDFAGGVVSEAALPRPRFRLRSQALLDEAEAALDRALAAAGMPRAALSAVGVGLPGLVRHESGRVLWSPILTDRDVAFGPTLRARLGLPVGLDNDANLLALSELWFGAARAEPDFAIVTIERGLGMGLVLGGRLWRGAMGLGMEIGHVTVQLDGALCRCGKRGCLEAYVADYALVREASTALDRDWGGGEPPGTEALLAALAEEARAGAPAARAIYERAGRYLAVGLANV
ncbi:MAG: ROK family protein, partial [Pseudomonadota bacterium]